MGLDPRCVVCRPGSAHLKRRQRGEVGRTGLGFWGAAAFAAVLAAGCVHGGPPQPPPPEPPEGQPLPHADFAAAVEAYGAAAEEGWTEEECRAVAARFEELSERRRGGLPAALFDAALAWSHCDAAEARRLFEAADATARRQDEDCLGHAPSLLRLGAEAYRQGDRERARRLFDRARQADRRSADAYHNLGLLGREAGDFAAAQRDLRRALAVDSDHFEAYTQMALLYLDLAEEDPQMLDIVELVCQQAVTRGREVRAPGPRVAPIHNAWGLARILRGNVVGAVEQFDRARQLDPDLFEAHMNSGAVTLSFRGYRAAEEAFRAAIRIHPDSYDAQVSLGAALRGLSRLAEAREAYEAARRLDPSRPDAYYNLGVLLQEYLIAEAAGVDDQIELLGEARRVFGRFIEACESQPERCLRQGSGGETEDMRNAARRRIEQCDELRDALGGEADPPST